MLYLHLIEFIFFAIVTKWFLKQEILVIHFLLFCLCCFCSCSFCQVYFILISIFQNSAISNPSAFYVYYVKQNSFCSTTASICINNISYIYFIIELFGCMTLLANCSETYKDRKHSIPIFMSAHYRQHMPFFWRTCDRMNEYMKGLVSLVNRQRPYKHLDVKSGTICDTLIAVLA